jgi:hypothetical protein
LNARTGARVLASGRVALGAALVLAPRRVAARWLGEHVRRPGVRGLVRMLGARDVVLGMVALHTVGHPEVGPRWQATCAVVDGVDLLANAGARSDLPAAGVAGTAALAGGAAVAGLYFARALKQG